MTFDGSRSAKCLEGPGHFAKRFVRRSLRGRCEAGARLMVGCLGESKAYAKLGTNDLRPEVAKCAEQNGPKAAVAKWRYESVSLTR